MKSSMKARACCLSSSLSEAVLALIILACLSVNDTLAWSLRTSISNDDSASPWNVESAPKEQQAHHDQHRGLQVSLAKAKPAQTYMIPLRESELIKSFNIIHSDARITDPVGSMTSIASSVRGTVIWYDEWEDGYETDVTNPTQSTTKIWGDGDPTNGCVEQIRARMRQSNPDYNYRCSSSDADIINAGEAFVLENSVPTGAARKTSEMYYDGGDLIMVSFPVALSRGCFPDNPRANGLMGGAVEIMESKRWGKEFVAPVGTDAWTQQGAFEMTEVWLMAIEDETVVSMNGRVVGTINRGEEMALRDVRRNDKITTDKTVQANLLTGDKRSTYEMRWYALLTVEQWYHDYYTPVHKTDMDDTNVILFNPNSFAIKVEHWIRESNTVKLKKTYTVNSGQHVNSDPLPYYSGSQFKTTNAAHKFYAISVTDWNTDGTIRAGNTHDWGHPLIPANMLTSQALIGLGYGCLRNNCQGNNPRSPIWLTSSVDADVYISFDGTGVAHRDYNPMKLDRLKGKTVFDPTDTDMTGAVIWATMRGQPTNNDGVILAVAWGQDPSLAIDKEEINLDMGTVVMPLPLVSASKTVSHAPDGDLDQDGMYSPGDVLEYTIRITNTGRVNIPKSVLQIVDDVVPLFDHTTYVAGSTSYMYETSSKDVRTVSVADDSSDTPFPLDGEGISNSEAILVGTGHHITFRVKVSQDPSYDRVVNVGYMKHNGVIKDTFRAEVPLNFGAPELVPRISEPEAAPPSEIECVSLDVEFERSTTIKQFSWYANNDDCVNAKVYVADTATTTSDDIKAGRMKDTWKVFCDSNVQCVGKVAKTVLPATDCTPMHIDGGTMKYVHIMTQKLHPTTPCLFPNTIEPVYSRTSVSEKVNDAEC